METAAPFRALPKKMAAGMGLGVAATMSMLQACGASSSDPSNDAGNERDVLVTDRSQGDGAIESGTAPDGTADGAMDRGAADVLPDDDVVVHDVAFETGTTSDVSRDARPEDGGNDIAVASDAHGERWDANPEVDAMLVDVTHAADADDVDDAPGDFQSDAGCQCVVPDDDASVMYVTTSLDCFFQGRSFPYDYATYLADPCIGLEPIPPRYPMYRGDRVEVTYPDRNLIGIWEIGIPDSPFYGYFFDATTLAPVGATRSSSIFRMDAIFCTQPAPFSGPRINVQAGRMPACADLTAICPGSSSRVLCARDAGPLDAGRSDASATD
jgi:hypothetical protein